MNQNAITVTYYLHSGFSIASGDTLLVFDYWRGEHQELPEERQISEGFLKQFDHVFVFISHEHPDHVDDIVYEWQKWANVTYIIHDDLPIRYRGKRIGVGGQITLSDRVFVRAYDSTDLGVSFYVELDGRGIFHAGDLNFWHWRDESSLKEIEEAEKEFIEKVAPIASEKIELAFFPMDPRQGEMSDAGANYFIMTVKPRILVPMHFWFYTDAVKDFARRNRNLTTEIIAMTQSGEEMDLRFGDNGAIEIATYAPVPLEALHPEDQDMGDKEVSLEEYEGQDPFAESDLPVSFDDNPTE